MFFQLPLMYFWNSPRINIVFCPKQCPQTRSSGNNFALYSCLNWLPSQKASTWWRTGCQPGQLSPGCKTTTQVVGIQSSINQSLEFSTRANQILGSTSQVDSNPRRDSGIIPILWVSCNYFPKFTISLTTHAFQSVETKFVFTGLRQGVPRNLGMPTCRPGNVPAWSYCHQPL